MKKRIAAAALALALLLSGCAGDAAQDQSGFAPPEDKRLVIYTSHREEVYEPIVKEFEQRTGIWVEVKTGDTAVLLDAIAAGGTDCDLMLGGGVDSISAYSDCFSPYTSVYNDRILPEYRSADGSYTPFSVLPVVLIYNTKLVRRNMPSGWDSLLDEAWRGRIAFADPNVSGSSYTAVCTMLQALGGGDELLPKFRQNLEGKILPSSGDVVSTVAEGKCYIGVTVEDIALSGIAEGYNIAIVYPEEGTSAMPDGAAIVDNCAHRENAEVFIDFLLSPDMQRLLPELTHRRSVCTNADITKADGSEITLIDYDLAAASTGRGEILRLWNGGAAG